MKTFKEKEHLIDEGITKQVRNATLDEVEKKIGKVAESRGDRLVYQKDIKQIIKELRCEKLSLGYGTKKKK